MSVVSYIVDTAQGFLNDAAETQFGAVAATVGTVTTVAVTLVLILVCTNMVFQYRAMDGRTAFWLGVKIALIGIFAQNWTQFNALSTAILNGIDSIAGSLISAVGGGAPGPSGTYHLEHSLPISSSLQAWPLSAPSGYAAALGYLDKSYVDAGCTCYAHGAQGQRDSTTFQEIHHG